MRGPCYLGKLGLFAPNVSEIHSLFPNHRLKRSIAALSPDCNDQVELWGPTARIYASLVPGVGTAHALNTLGKLACWIVKQSNVTTEILSEMVQDMDSLRHQILQNRAAIDFLLLAQGHSCENFEEMCCFNLSSNSKSIHQHLQWLRDHTRNIKVVSNPIDKWLSSFGLGQWLRTFIMYALGIGIVILFIIILLPCLLTCLQNLVLNLIHKSQANVFLLKENGGNVDDLVSTWLQEKGHEAPRSLAT
ncbi:syncytin-A-like [Phaenicophaeus curvirostris]|uniref:syncytin-A-like n=1 Tax=Phaenicophaeus curvirostris TaxID=33595 RepID=UPI0037F098AA